MTHLRTIIRQTFRDVLESSLSSEEYVVVGTRTSKRNRTDETVIDVRFTEIDVSQNSMGDDRTHMGTLMIRVYRSGDEAVIDDLLDLDEARVTGAVYNYDWSQLLEDEPELKRISFEREDTTDETVGVLVLQFSVEYRINKLNPNLMRS
jgi:hypothetical protein